MKTRSAIASLVISLSLAVLFAAPASAQAHRNTAVDSLRQIQEMSPTYGPPGTPVHISTLNLPVQAKVHVGYGATRTGFEALFEVQQGMWGDVEAEIIVPETAPTDRAIVFVAFNAIFSPIGLSQPFHVIGPNGNIKRTGTVVSNDDGCRAFEDTDGWRYALTGDIAGALANGAPVIVEGRYSPTETCGSAGTIRLVSFTPAGG